MTESPGSRDTVVMSNKTYSLVAGALLALASAACSGTDAAAPAVRIGNAFVATPVARFDEPWAMTFLPDGRLLVTEKPGALKLVDVATKQVGDVTGVPKVAHGGQGGFGDVILHPEFAKNSIVYVSYSEPGEGGSGSAVARARLALSGNGGKLEELAVIWRQVPKVSGQGHFGHRLAFGPDGKLWITSSERQKFTPAQDMKANLGKVVRLNEDGSTPADNPFFAQGGVTAQIWSLGHRNLLGIAFAPDGKLYAHEMGPRGGDELNLIEKGANYGYPIVSNGDHYDGRDIPDHPTRPEFKAPLITWNPVISPAGFIIYTGKLFPDWNGNG
ncbi:MAG: PQQ-dependent sugar dehydrogenase, partial [Steroidobacteraceae bacterium]|nr:PQQ-dependent sugar dehydrogenase [Steroidobacteraceae bacterium]